MGVATNPARVDPTPDETRTSWDIPLLDERLAAVQSNQRDSPIQKGKWERNTYPGRQEGGIRTAFHRS
jgi:hypothetical protein